MRVGSSNWVILDPAPEERSGRMLAINLDHVTEMDWSPTSRKTRLWMNTGSGQRHVDVAQGPLEILRAAGYEIGPLPAVESPNAP